MFQWIISQKSFKRMLLIIFGLYLFFSLMSALVLYKRLALPLSPHYGAAITVVTQVKDSLWVDTFKINLLFYLLTAIGVILLCVLYSHRIAGPLFRVKKYAALLGEGRFDERINFRKKDAIQSLAAALNETAASWQTGTDRFLTHLESLEKGLIHTGSLPGQSKEKTESIKRLRRLDAAIRRDNEKIKL